MDALLKVLGLRWDHAAEKAIDTPSRTFIEIATHPTVTSPLAITNYGWIFSVMFAFVWMVVISLICAANFSSNLTMKVSVQRYKNQVKKLEEQLGYLEDTHEKTNSSLLDTRNELLQQKEKIEQMTVSFGEERVTQARTQIAAAAHCEREISDCLRMKDTEHGTALRAAAATYNTNLEQKDAEHSAELSRKDAQHLSEMKAHNKQSQDTIIKNQSIYHKQEAHLKRRIQGLMSERDCVNGKFERLTTTATQKDANITCLQDGLLELKHEMTLLENQHRVELEIKERKRKKAADAAHEKAWEEAEKEIRTAEEKTRKLKYSIQCHEEITTKSKAEAAQAQLRAKEAESAKAKLAEELEAKNVELTQSVEVVKNMQTDLEVLRASITAKEQDIAQLKKDVEDAANKMTKKTKEWETERKQLARHQGRKGSWNRVTPTRKTIEASAEAAQLQPETPTPNDEVKRARTELSIKEKELSTVKAALALNKAKLADIPKLKTERDQIKEENSELVRAQAKHDTANSALKQERDHWGTEHDKKAAALDQCSGRLENAEREFKDLQALCTKLKESNDRTAKDVEMATDRLRKAYDQLDTQDDIIKGLKNKSADKQWDEQAAIDKIEQLNEQLETVREQLEKMTANSDENEAALLKGLDENEVWQRDSIAAKAKIHDLSTKFENASTKLEHEAESQRKLRDLQSMTQTQVDWLRKDSTAKDEKISDLEKRLARQCVCKRQPYSSQGNPDPSQGRMGPPQGDAAPPGDEIDNLGGMEPEYSDPAPEDSMEVDASASGTETRGEQANWEVDMAEADDTQAPPQVPNQEPPQERDIEDVDMVSLFGDDGDFEDVLSPEVQTQQQALNSSANQNIGPNVGHAGGVSREGLSIPPEDYMTDGDLQASSSYPGHLNIGNQSLIQTAPLPLSIYARSHGLTDAEASNVLTVAHRREQDLARARAKIGESSKATPLEQDLGLDKDFESNHASDQAESETSGNDKGKGKALVREGIPRTRVIQESTQPSNAPLPGLTFSPPEAPPSSVPAAAAAPPPIPSWLPRDWDPNFNFTSPYDLSAPGALDDPAAAQEENAPTEEPSNTAAGGHDFSALEAAFDLSGVTDYDPSTYHPTQETTSADQTATAAVEDTGSDLDLTPEEEEIATAAAEAQLARYNEQAAAVVTQVEGGDQADPNDLEVIDPSQLSDRDSDVLSQPPSSEESSNEDARDYVNFTDQLAETDDEGTERERPAAAEVGMEVVNGIFWQGMEAISDTLPYLRQLVLVGDLSIRRRILQEIAGVRTQIDRDEAAARQRPRTAEEFQESRNSNDEYWRDFRRRLPAIEAEERRKLGLEQAKINTRPKAVPKSRKRGNLLRS